MKKKTIGISVAVVALAAAGGTAFYFNQKGSDVTDGIYVQSVAELTGSVVITDRFSGVTEAQDSVDFNVDSAKSVAEVYVELGQEVKKGDALFKYDTSEASNNIASLKLEIEGLNNEINALNADINELTQQKNALPKEEQYQIIADIQQKQMDLRQAGYDIQSKNADITKYQKEIDQATVVSTIDGTVESLNRNGGVSETGESLPFISITQTGEFRIKGKIDEQSMGTITAGQEVIVRSRVNQDQTWNGTVSQIETKPNNNNNQYDGGSDSSTTYPFYVSLENGSGLMLGQHVLIEPNYGQAAAMEGLWLDTSFVVMDEDEAYVWKDVNGKLQKQTVVTGEENEDIMQIQITEGLDKNDYIAWPSEDCKAGEATMKDIFVEDDAS